MHRGMLEALYSRENYEIAKKMLDANQVRHQALSSNIANTNTPGYQRVDLAVDFKQQLVQAIQNDNISHVRSIEPTLQEDRFSRMVRADGNNVSLENELLELGNNATEHQFLTQYLSGSIKRIKSAITGSNGS